MPKMEIQIHPLAAERLYCSHIDTQTKDRGTGRTDAIILQGIVDLQRRGYTDDRGVIIKGIVDLQRRGYTDDMGVIIKDHYAGTNAHLANFGNRAADIIDALGYGKHIRVNVELADHSVVLGWRNV